MIKPRFLQNRIELWEFGLRDSLHRSIAKIPLFFLLLLSTFSYAFPTASEHEIKAAFLYKLKHFVKLPQQLIDKNKYFFICILGEDPFNEKIDLIVKEEDIVKVLRISEIKQAENCQILFISESEYLRLDSIFKWLEHKPILNVSDIQDFASHGGMIEFYQEEGSVRLAINPKNVSKTTLKVSAHLLRISRIIDSNTRKGKTSE